MKKYYRRLNYIILQKTKKHITKEHLSAYRNILKLLYHPDSEKPSFNSDAKRYVIQVPSLHLDLIISASVAEIVNTQNIYPLELPTVVLERAIDKIREELTRRTQILEDNIKGKKSNILKGVYKKIIIKKKKHVPNNRKREIRINKVV